MTLRPPPLLDRLGAAGSLLCAIHCALWPLAIALLPSLGLALWLGDGLETGFVAFVSLFGLGVLGWSYRRHRNLRALLLLLAGLVVLWAGMLYPPLHQAAVPHAVFMALGGGLVGVGHLVNLRLNHGHAHGAACTRCPAPY
ncbi:MerC domain-containing protein [Thermomonas sp.]|uniref:MerC domain-containing protein n=1 Tax=Thermomonas sp. TaxID=1971895 RepID=UPI00391DE058